MPGLGRAAPSLSWMTQRWSRTGRFPAPRTSSAKPSRSPRIFRNSCEQLRITNTRGQKDPTGFFCSVSTWTSFQSSCICRYLVAFRFVDLSGIFTPLLALGGLGASCLSADRVSAKACAASGTVWDVSALWCPGLRSPPPRFIHSACDPPNSHPGTLASVPASQAQFDLPPPPLFLPSLTH